MSDEVITDQDWHKLDAAKHLFYHVREFVSEKFPKLRKVVLGGFCDDIYRYRNDHADDLRGRRAFMHVGHHNGVVCTWLPALRKLTPNHLIGLYLHEFGHISTGKGDDAADRWVERNFGIHICYTGSLALEWVRSEDGMKVLWVKPKMPTPRRRRR